MDKILVPVDFSASSDWGFYYAYQLAKQFDAQLVVVHLYRPPYVDTTMPNDMIKEIIANKETEMRAHLQANTQAPLHDTTGKPVEVKLVLESWASASLSEIAQRENADLIIMGTHGADRAWDKVWGTNTSKVIAEAHCPVIAVPSGVEFKSLKCLAYATDYDVTDLDNIQQLAVFAQSIGAEVHCVHINVIGADTPKAKQEAFDAAFVAKFKDSNVSFCVRSAVSVEDGLATFLRINHIDILSMLTHTKKTFWERLFGGRSTTQSMSMRTQIPLLAFHK